MTDVRGSFSLETLWLALLCWPLSSIDDSRHMLADLYKSFKIANFVTAMTQRTQNIRNMNMHAESRSCRIVFVHWFSGFI